MSKRILIIATHPDDETLGCGGTLLKHIEAGDEVFWCIVTTYDQKTTDNQVYTSREKEIDKVMQAYSFSELIRLPFYTTTLDSTTIPQLISYFSTMIKRIQPDTLYLPYAFDVHSDHRVTFEAIYSCTKSFRYPFIKRILMMETLSETEFAIPSQAFQPNVFIDISNFMQKKIEIMKIYKSELSDHPFPRSIKSIEALATLRGSAAQCNYAESFMLLKEIS